MLLDDSWENGTILKAVLSDVMQTGSAVPGQGAPGHFDAAAGATGGAAPAAAACSARRLLSAPSPASPAG